MELLPEDDLPYVSRITECQFYILGSDENKLESNVEINTNELFKNDEPVPQGVYDLSMGTMSDQNICNTCGNAKNHPYHDSCPGHVGSLNLKYPVKNPLFKHLLLHWLNAICFSCGNLIIKRQLKNVPKNNLLSEYVKMAKKVSNCEHCGKERYRVYPDKMNVLSFMIDIPVEGTTRRGSKETVLTKRVELFNHNIKQILEKVSDETVVKAGKAIINHPKKLIISTARISPNSIRPDIKKLLGNRSNNCDITALTKNLVEQNMSLPDIPPSNEMMTERVKTAYDTLEVIYHDMLKGSSSGTTSKTLHIESASSSKPSSSIMSRIPKKTGRLRKNLLGSRTKKIARSVITGDPTIRVDDLCVPVEIAKEISIPETVTEFNRDKLSIYFNNRDHAYPGCISLWQKSKRARIIINRVPENYKLEIGDILHRNMVDGDVVNFNRQPSLIYPSISAHTIKVMPGSKTFRMAPNACVLYNADFDGDEMSIQVPASVQSRNEIANLSAVKNWFVSYQDKKPLLGIYLDSLMGIAEFTKANTKLDKWHSMMMFAHVDNTTKPLNFQKSEYTSREVLDYVMPKINLINKAPKFYMKQYDPYIQYNPEDINVNIINGQLESGILDKMTVGQGAQGSIFHIIHNKFGTDTAMESIFNFQQVGLRYFIYNSFTIGIKDIILSMDATKKIKEKTKKLLLDSQVVIEKLNDKQLVPPLGQTLNDFYEQEQTNTLATGDEFVIPILNDIDFESNNLAKMVFTGTKGSPNDIISINSIFGLATVGGVRPRKHFGWYRTSPYFHRYDLSPQANGFVTNSLFEGIPVDSMLFVASEGQYGLICNALSTSISGTRTRTCVKNSESIIVDNTRKSVIFDQLVQPLYSETGFDQRFLEKVVFLTINISDKDMDDNYHSIAKKDFDKIFQNENIQKMLDDEFRQLKEDRELYRSIYLQIESDNLGTLLLSHLQYLPINMKKIIDDVLFDYLKSNSAKDAKDAKDAKAMKKNEKFNPVDIIDKVRKLCDELPYVYFNEIYKNKKGVIPNHIHMATNLLKIYIRGYLSTAHLNKMGITNKLLNIIIDTLLMKLKYSFMDYGKAVGVLASQCITSPLTQYLLDSKHRTGGGSGTKTDTLVRVNEVFNATPTDKMKNPSMTIMIKDEFNTDELKVKEIANYIEMMSFERFIDGVQIFFEEYGNPVHSQYKHEIKMIEDFEKYHFGLEIPRHDLTKWCIRYELNRREMIINKIKLDNIVNALQNVHPNIFLVYTPENIKSLNNIVIRCYLMRSMFKTKEELKKLYDKDHIISVSETIGKTIVRGIDGIENTEIVNNIIKTKISDDGSLTTNKVFAIDTSGINMTDIIDNPYIDLYKTQPDSVSEFENIYGIAAARNKIILELVKTMPDLSREHCALFADTMTMTGKVTSSQKSGLQAREPNNAFLQMAFQSPQSFIENAANNSIKNNIYGASASLLTGNVSENGTLYNKCVVNTEFISNYHKTEAQRIEDDL
jgi:DNA-directed RNA polymerase II subunit RPB1